MEYKERILININKLDRNLEEIENIVLNDREKEVVESAKNYREDCKYYLKKGQDFTALDCIAYSHGLLDSLRIIHGFF
jgi:hypothetical protein